jgi:peptidoglycan/LPS O-acetylase OafA/YrhL
LAAKSAVDHAHNLKPWLNLQPNSYIIVGLILSFFSLFLIFMRRNPALPGARAAGALTYPLYLIHNNVGVLIIASIGLKWLGLGVALAAVLSLSWLINRVIERRYAALWKRLADQSIGALVRRSTSLRMR